VTAARIFEVGVTWLPVLTAVVMVVLVVALVVWVVRRARAVD
jgi:hypothetical protein